MKRLAVSFTIKDTKDLTPYRMEFCQMHFKDEWPENAADEFLTALLNELKLRNIWDNKSF
jgi:hypothetical protein